MESKGADKNYASILQHVSVLVMDPDTAVANIVKRVLIQLGFGKVIVEHSSKNAAAVFQRESIDFIITELEMEKVDESHTFVEFIRCSSHSPNPAIPIILLTGYTDRQEVEIARDMGITEFAAKPFTAKTLCNRIIHIIENPRSFIFTKRYSGPDRRRRDAVPPPGGCRRQEDLGQSKTESEKPRSLFNKILGKTP